MMYTKTDLKASGATAIAGGEYGEVRVSASLKVRGSLKCDSMNCSGSVKIEENLDCTGSVSCSGSTKVEGHAAMGSGHFSGSLVCEQNLNVEKGLHCSGSAKVGGDLRCGEGRFSGSCEVDGSISCQELHCSGKLETSGGVEAEHFVSSGALEIPGLLNAEKVEIKISGNCEVGDIGGGTIEVKRDWRGISFGRGRPRLEARTIEGDAVSLESTCARMVRGKNIRIGRDCEIDRVEYSGELLVDGGCVHQQVRID
ncbi:MAG: hypothetical protein J6I89_05145 [Oscillospiraceae bacterium]|nr:hypothetical protein [Oscillospiraceae bacterium]